MVKEIRMATDGATVKTKGQDLIVLPKRFVMFLVAIILVVFGALFLFAFLGNLIKTVTEGEWSDALESFPMIILAAGLIFVAYFAFSKGKNQRAVHFDAALHQVKIGNETIPFDRITAVYLCHMGNMTFGDISGTVVQTGIVSDTKTMPISSVSKPKQEDNMADAVILIRLYAEHLGHDPNLLGKYEDLIALDLQPKLPVILAFKARV